MSVKKVEILVSHTEDPSDAQICDATLAALAGQPILINIGAPFALRHFWARITTSNEISADSVKDFDLGVYRTEDNTPPVIGLGVSLSNKTSIVASYSAADSSGHVEPILHIGTRSNVIAADVINDADSLRLRIGDSIVGEHTFHRLEYETDYYVTLLASDLAGNEALKSDKLTTGPMEFFLRPPDASEGDADRDVVIQVH